MPKSRKRKPADHSRGRRRQGGRPDGPTGVATVLMNELAPSRDPFGAEVLLSTSFGIAYASQVFDKQDIVDHLASMMLSKAVTSARPGALELVAALATVGPESIRPLAHAELERRLAERRAAGRTEPPPLVAALTAPISCTAAWLITEPYGDATQYVATFAREGWLPEHAVVWLVAERSMPIAESLILSDDAAELLEAMRSLVAAEPGMAMSPIDPAELHAQVRSAMDNEAQVMGPAAEAKDYAFGRLLAYARLRSLPPAPELPDLVPIDVKAREEILDRFMASPAVVELLAGVAPPDDDAPDSTVVRSVASLALDFAADYLGDPMRVSPRTIEMFMLDWLPRNALLDPEQTRWAPEVLDPWVAWVAEQRGLDDEQHEEMSEFINELQVDFFNLMAKGEGRGFAAQLAARFLDEGVDFDDPAALEAAVERYNSSLEPGGPPPF